MPEQCTQFDKRWTPPSIVAQSHLEKDDALFERLGLRKVSGSTEGQWVLTREHSAASPLSLVRPDGVSLNVDFTAGKTRHRTTESGMGAQILARALGVKKYVKTHERHPTIIDATGGLGQDSWALASIGCTVFVLERHAVVHALFEDALERAANESTTQAIANRIKLTHAKAEAVLMSLTTSSQAHAMYLDPMYPHRRKSASSKKGMQFLQAILGVDNETQSLSLLKTALECGVSKVVVKRPKGATELAEGAGFSGQKTRVESPNTRYDVYHLQS